MILKVAIYVEMKTPVENQLIPEIVGTIGKDLYDYLRKEKLLEIQLSSGGPKDKKKILGKIISREKALESLRVSK